MGRGIQRRAVAVRSDDRRANASNVGGLAHSVSAGRSRPSSRAQLIASA